MGILLLLGVFGLMILVPILKWTWPSADERSTTPMIGSVRPVTTGQIARGVFWGLWLFVLSQAVLGLIFWVAAMAFVGSRL